MVTGRSDININKAIKGATKPEEAPPKDKYIYSIRNYVAKAKHPEVSYVRLSHLLVPKLNDPSLIVSLKAHLVFHQLISDVTAPKYVFLSYLSKHYATANRSSVDCTTFDILSDYRNFNCQSALPNLAHSIPQDEDRNRLISAYNRYLRERILHFRFLKLDPIREKIEGTSLVDTSHRHKLHLLETSGDLINLIQCSIQQIRLILSCMFSPESLNHPLYSYCYGLAAMDLSILFRFLNLALVAALQSFFNLPRECAEKTLFAYKEYTQLQLAEDVHSFISLGPNAVSPKDMDIPGPLRKDQLAVKQLTKSFEDFLYGPKPNDVEAGNSATNTTTTQHIVRQFSESSISQSGSYSTIASSSTNATSHSITSTAGVNNNHKNNIVSASDTIVTPSQTSELVHGIGSSSHPSSHLGSYSTPDLPSQATFNAQQSQGNSFTSPEFRPSLTSPSNLEIPRRSPLREQRAELKYKNDTLDTDGISNVPKTQALTFSSSTSTFLASLNAQTTTSVTPALFSTCTNNVNRLAELQSSMGGHSLNPYQNPRNYEFDGLARQISRSDSTKDSQNFEKDFTEENSMSYDLQSVETDQNNPYNLSKPTTFFTGSDTTLRQRSTVTSSIYDSASSSYSTPNLAQGFSQRKQSIYSSYSGDAFDDRATSRYSSSSLLGGADSPKIRTVATLVSKHNQNTCADSYDSSSSPFQPSKISGLSSSSSVNAIDAVSNQEEFFDNLHSTANQTSNAVDEKDKDSQGYAVSENAETHAATYVMSAPAPGPISLNPTNKSLEHTNGLHNSFSPSGRLDRGGSLSSVESGYVSITSTNSSSNNNSSMTSLGSGSGSMDQHSSKHYQVANGTTNTTTTNSTSTDRAAGLQVSRAAAAALSPNPEKGNIPTTVTPLSPRSISRSSPSRLTISIPDERHKTAQQSSSLSSPLSSYSSSSLSFANKHNFSNISLHNQNNSNNKMTTSTVTLAYSELSSEPVSSLDPGSIPFSLRKKPLVSSPLTKTHTLPTSDNGDELRRRRSGNSKLNTTGSNISNDSEGGVNNTSRTSKTATSEDTNDENWQQMLDSLDSNSGTSFSLNFDVASKLDKAGNSINGDSDPLRPITMSFSTSNSNFSSSSLTSSPTGSVLSTPKFRLPGVPQGSEEGLKGLSKKFKFIPGIGHRSNDKYSQQQQQNNANNNNSSSSLGPFKNVATSKNKNGSESTLSSDSPSHKMKDKMGSVFDLQSPKCQQNQQHKKSKADLYSVPYSCISSGNNNDNDDDDNNDGNILKLSNSGSSNSVSGYMTNITPALVADEYSHNNNSIQNKIYNLESSTPYHHLPADQQLPNDQLSNDLPQSYDQKQEYQQKLEQDPQQQQQQQKQANSMMDGAAIKRKASGLLKTFRKA